GLTVAGAVVLTLVLARRAGLLLRPRLRPLPRITVQAVPSVPPVPPVPPPPPAPSGSVPPAGQSVQDADQRRWPEAS
ncbi:MAG: hypothetical protein ACODAF_07125, partial [Actinomycetota bacterium]